MGLAVECYFCSVHLGGVAASRDSREPVIDSVSRLTLLPALCLAACATQPAQPQPEPAPGPLVMTGPSAGGELETSEESRCDLPSRFHHETRNDGARDVLYGADALVFVSNYAVNTDGAPTSYHPDDPWGSRGLAINTVCNGVDAITPEGERVRYDQCSRLVALFEEARDGGWLPEGGPRVGFYGIAARGDGEPDRFLPCINGQAPYEGYLVSTTSLAADPSLARCDQSRYLNALEVPFVIVPGHRNFTSRGVEVRDLAVVHQPATGRTVFAVVGDRGPSWGLGEGSVYLAKALSGRTETPTTRREVNRMGPRGVVTLLLPKTNLAPPYTVERIDEAGRAALARFGGVERLEACAAEIGGP